MGRGTDAPPFLPRRRPRASRALSASRPPRTVRGSSPAWPSPRRGRPFGRRGRTRRATMQACGLRPSRRWVSSACSQIQINLLVEGDRVAVATGLPVASHAWLHQQPLALVVVIGCNLARQRGAWAHDAHPFAQDENPYVRVSGRKSPLNCGFLYCQRQYRQRIALRNHAYRFTHIKNT